MIKRKGRMRDRFGNLIEDDDAICPDGGVLSVDAVFMDARAGAPPSGKYILYDRCGRPAGLGDERAELKRRASYEDYKARLASAHRKLTPVRDGEPAGDRGRQTPEAVDITSTLGDARSAAWLRYVARLQSAHKRV